MKNFTEEQEKEIISFYLQPNSAKEVYRVFKVALYTLRRILKKYNIPEHSKEVYTKAEQEYSKQTCLKRYGVESSNQAEVVKEKMKATLYTHYGVTSPAKNSEVQKKMQATCLERYGVANVFNSPEIQQKIKNTCITKYGYEHPSKVPEFIEKRKATNIMRYGSTCTLQHTDIQEKAKDTWRQKYGTDDISVISALPEVIKKRQNTFLTKYGVESYSQTYEAQKTRRTTYYVATEQFDSFPELAVYMYAVDHNEPIKHNTIRLPYEYDSKIHYYFPDFEYKGQLLEIKGDHFFDENGILCNPFDRSKDPLFAAKYKCMIDNNVTIWRSKDYQFAIDYFNSKYNKEDFRIKGT